MHITSPLVSVYITNFNYGRFIKQSVESVLSQTFQDFELIIIDDGSTDDSRDIIEEYKEHPKIKIIYQQNKGLNVTNNIATRVSRGKYLMRLDADDFLDKHALFVLSNVLDLDRALGLVFPDYYLVDTDGRVIGLERRHAFTEEVSLFDQPAHGACTMVRREYLLEVGGYDENFKCQDGYDLWVKFISKYKVTNVNLPLFYYRRHGSNLTRNENNLLETRAKIKNSYFENNCDQVPVIAVLPIRGSKISSGDFSLYPLGDKLVIDWLIDEVVKATRIALLVITSPDEEIRDHVLQRYVHNSNLVFHLRHPDQARLNVGLVETMETLLSLPSVQEVKPDLILRLSTHYPFITAGTIDDAINTLIIFGADSLLSVRPETMTFYYHDGNGLTPLFQERFTRLERDALYQNSGGLVVSRVSLLRDQRILIGGKVGHIVIDQKAAHGIYSDYDFNIARFLATNQS